MSVAIAPAPVPVSAPSQTYLSAVRPVPDYLNVTSTDNVEVPEDKAKAYDHAQRAIEHHRGGLVFVNHAYFEELKEKEEQGIITKGDSDGAVDLVHIGPFILRGRISSGIIDAKLVISLPFVGTHDLVHLKGDLRDGTGVEMGFSLLGIASGSIRVYIDDSKMVHVVLDARAFIGHFHEDIALFRI